MYSEKTRLTDKRENPFYGSYKERSLLDEIHWENKKKHRQLAIITTVIIVLTLLAVGITLGITLPPLLDKQANNTLSPPDPRLLDIKSTSRLGIFSQAAVSSEDETCSSIGRNVLENLNGTAVDAAVAVVLCLGVCSPQSSGLGGGLFMTIYSDGRMYGLNARETAPQNIDPETYNSDISASLQGGLAVGIPGELHGLWTAHQKFGKVAWSDLVRPARDLAQDGFRVNSHLAQTLLKYEKLLNSDAVLKSEFLNPATGKPWVESDLLKRPRLGKTLESLESIGGSGFYNGTLSASILQDLQAAGSIITADDLKLYNSLWVEPIQHDVLENFTLIGLPFPSSGAVVAMSLGILEGFGRHTETTLSPAEEGLDAHRFIETLKFAETHRSRIADPRFDDGSELTNLLDDMLSEEYQTNLRSKIQDYHTTNDPNFYGTLYERSEEFGTAQVSIIGPNGDAVSLTTSINRGFGAGFMGNSTGIIFNNHINDFSFPNKTDVYGLPSNPNNLIEPGKQPASSMSPVILLDMNGHPVLATGGSGGSAIIPAVVSTAWRAIYRDLDIRDATDYPRFAVKMGGGLSEVHYEYGYPSYVITDLHRKGHQTKRIDLKSYLGNVNSVGQTKETRKILACADSRKQGGYDGF